MPMKTTLAAHLRAALAAAIVLGLCQIVIETIVIAAWARSFLLGPYSLGGTQMYDFGVKIAAALPVTAGWLHGGPLDRFLADGFLSKLILCRALLIPNLLVLVALGFVIGIVGFLLARPARPVSVVLILAAFGLAVHGVTFAETVFFPGSAWALIRNTARLLVSDGAGVAVFVLSVATLLAVVIARLPWPARLATLGALAGVAAVMLAVSSPPSAAHSATRAGPNPPLQGERSPQVDNVVLISIDSLRADRLGCYGNRHNTSPVMDELARNGIRFANAMSTTSWTLPAHMSLLTGRSLLSHRVILQKDRLPDGVPTLAEALRQGGLATAGVVSALFLRSEYGFDRGFDYYDDHTATAPTVAAQRRNEPADEVTELAVNWLRAHYQKRFFLFVHFWDVHFDYVPPHPYDEMFDPDYTGSITGADFITNPAVRKGIGKRDLLHLLALYDGEIRWVDEHVGRLLSTLDGLHLADRTAVIITADHGDEFFEHGGKGHGRNLYREVMHVPLLLRIPGKKEGAVLQNRVSLVDVAPTIFDLTGIAKLHGMDGISLMPMINDGQVFVSEPVGGFLCDRVHQTHCEAVQSSDAGTLICKLQPMGLEFYRPSDLQEQHNVAGSSEWPRENELRRLAESLNSNWQSHLRSGSRGAVHLDKATRERLRALGY
jgi:arylsulfatase A-like enzyme